MNDNISKDSISRSNVGFNWMFLTFLTGTLLGVGVSTLFWQSMSHSKLDSVIIERESGTNSESELNLVKQSTPIVKPTEIGGEPSFFMDERQILKGTVTDISQGEFTLEVENDANQKQNITVSYNDDTVLMRAVTCPLDSFLGCTGLEEADRFEIGSRVSVTIVDYETAYDYLAADITIQN